MGSPSQAGRLLAVVGDSYAFGWGIRDAADRFGERLVRTLNQDTTEKWRLVNASVGNRHTLQEFALMDSVMRFSPDVVILLYVFNDIDYLSPPDSQVAWANHGKSFASRLAPIRLLFLNSYLFQELLVRFRQLTYPRLRAVVSFVKRRSG